jgi:tetratricopeptide (TPR) repeat protein
MTEDSGIVYVATKQERYVVEAFLSASSAKALMPDLPVTLFTDLVDSGFARDDCFDQVVPIESSGRFRSQWAEGQFERIRCLNRSPYQRTLHLDTDTRVLSADIADVFSRLDAVDIAMVEAAPDASASRRAYGQPMFNVGFILYRKAEKVAKLFQEWEALTRRNFELASQDPLPEVECLAHITDPKRRRNILFMDQISMVQLLSPTVNVFGLAVEILHECWNFRGSGSGRVLDRPVIVDHRPQLRNVLDKDILQRTALYEQAGNYRGALGIYRTLLNHAPDDALLLKASARCLVQLGNTREAEQLLSGVLERSPADQDAIRLLEVTRGRAPD